MFIASVKFSKVRIAVVLLALGVIVAAAFWSKSQITVQAQAGTKFEGISTNEKRVQLIESYGWKVDPNAIEVVEVTIPQVFNATYNNYNAIQKKQGFDLARYTGKRVKRWTYKVTNFAGVTDEVHANLLIYNDTVIGGDVSTVALGGFMQGLARQTDASSGTAAKPQSADITSDIFSAVTAK